MEKELITSLKSKFDNMAHFDAENNIEFWYARELQTAFEYAQWRNFNEVIDKAKTACTNSEIDPSYHFADVSKMVSLGSGSQRKIDDIKLTRYACYLIAQNGDPRKETIAFAQTYFALQTRKQELIEERLENIRRKVERRLKAEDKKISKDVFKS